MRCGRPLASVPTDGRVRPACRACGWVYFRNPSSASAAAVVSGGRVVLVRRSVAPYVGSWCLPSGYQEYDESPEETAVRETREETNLRIRLLGLCGVYFSDGAGVKNTVVHVYLAERVGGTMRAGDDASDVRLFPLDGLPRRIAFREHLDFIEEIRAGRAVLAPLRRRRRR